MAREYLESLSAFVIEATTELSGIISLECKHFFSGAALYAENRICISLTPVGLAMKLPEGTKDNLFRDKRAVPLRYFPEGPIKSGYALFPGGVVSLDGADGSEPLHGYVRESIEYVLTLPKPKSRRKRQ